MLLGEKISTLREVKGYSKEQLSVLLEVSIEKIENWENGYEVPDSMMIRKIASLFNVSEEYFISNFQQPTNSLENVKSSNSNHYFSLYLTGSKKKVIIIFLIIGAILTPIASMFSIPGISSLFYISVDTGSVNFFFLLEYLYTIPVCICTLKKLDSAHCKRDLIGWGVTSMLLVSFIGGFLILVMINDNDFVDLLNVSEISLFKGNEQEAIKRGISYFNKKQYHTALSYFREANIKSGGHNTLCIEYIIRCLTDNLNTFPSDEKTAQSIISKKEYIEDIEVAQFIAKYNSLLTGKEQHITLENDSVDRAKVLISQYNYKAAKQVLLKVPNNDSEIKELLTDCDKNIPLQEKYEKALKYIQIHFYNIATSILRKITNYRDSEKLIQKYVKDRKRNNITIAISISAVILLAFISISIPTLIIPNVKCNRIIKNIDSNDTSKILTSEIKKGEIALLRKKANVYENGIYYLSTSNNKYAYCLGTDSSAIEELNIESTCIAIANYAFYDCDTINKMTVSDNIVIIGKDSFTNCSIEEIIIPYDKVKVFPKDLFKKVTLLNCTKIDEYAFYKCSNLTKIVIPYGVKIIERSAFSDCISLVNIDIPSTIEEIHDFAFNNCKSLKSIELPDGLTILNNSPFYNCSALKTIVLPNSLTFCSTGSFSGCKSLEYATVPSIALASLPKSIKHIVITSGNSIPANVFSSYTNLESVSILTDMAYIGNNAFTTCPSLKTINIPNGVKTIGSWSFASCYNLDKMVLPDSIEEIGEYAFADVYNFEIVIPISIKKLGTRVFNNSTNIIIFYGGTKSEWDLLMDKSPSCEIHQSFVYYYSEDIPTSSGNYWHYVDGNPVVWP